MAPLRLDIVVDDQGQPVPQSFAQPVGQDMPVGISTLSPDESIPMHEVMQSKALAFHAVQSLNTLAAQAAAEFQRLRAPVAALIEQATATNVHAAFLTENARFQKMWSSMTEENTRFQQFQKELSIAPLWEEESKRLQKMAASFRAMEREAQALINPAPPPWLATIRDALLSLPATVIPEWVQVRQLSQAAFERRMCADALQAFSHDPKTVERFVTQVLGLPFSCLCAVWQALHNGGWMNADKPFKHVRRVAMHLYVRDTEQNESMLNSTLLIPDDPWPEQEPRHDEEQRLKQQGLSAGLSPDALVILPTSLTPQERDAHARLALAPAAHPRRKRGRPPGSGTYATADDFLQAVRPILQRLRREGVYPSQARVAELLPCRTSVRQLQRWGETHRLTWLDVLKSA